MNIAVIRCNTSAYFESDFIENEKKAIEQLSSKITYFESFEAYNTTRKTESGPTKIIAITNTHTQMALLEQLGKNLELVIHPNSGFDNFSLNFVKNCPAPIILGNPIRAQAVCEYILSSLFDAITPLKKDQNWDRERRFNRKLISNNKIMIVGYGIIGTKLHSVLQSLGADTEIYDPFKKPTHLSFKKSVELFNPDVIVFCASLNPISRQMLSSEIFQLIKNDIVIINAARGELIHEKSMLDFSETHPDSKFYLDVFEQEPCDFSKFESLQFIKSSHSAGVFNTLTSNIIDFETEVIDKFLTLIPHDFKLKFRHLSLHARVSADYLF